MQVSGMKRAVAGLMSAVAAGSFCPAFAQEGQRHEVNLPAEPLSEALRDLATATHGNIIAAARDTEGKRAAALSGSYTLPEAIDHLLAGTGLHVEVVDGNYLIRRGGQMGDASNGIIVTGSRIAGAPVASQVISVSRSVMEETGYSDLGRLVRDIPQSFSGGQNPGVGTNVPAGRGVDVGGASSINLRGLGSDATLTLLNGHRVPYTASRQSVDVSAIPFGMIDRIEIVPDGASALYGSDAVAGVANIVLRRDMKGVETNARIGGSTDGGNFQQQYGLAGGERWKNGGFILAYDYSSSDAIWGRQRSYARDVAPKLSLMPAIWHHSMAFNGHQALSDRLTFTTDAYFNLRRSTGTYPQVSGGQTGTGALNTKDQIWGIAPTLKLQLDSGWRFNLASTTGKERVDLVSTLCLASCSTTATSYYRNSASSVELNGDGKLLDLPGGPLKLAGGGGYRTVSFIRYAGVGSAVNTQHSQDSYYAFGELAIPIIGPSQEIPFIRQLNASAAVRYERYPGVASVATPKFGLIYAPGEDFDIKASWGKSFRVPTLYEQYQPRSVYLYPARSVGAASTSPATSAVLLALGGSPSLKPERATTWSTGITFHPRAVPGARLEVTYFNIHYRDRIVTPITTLSQALSNPIFGDQITYAPDAATQAAVIGAASAYLNATSYPYNSANVVAIVDNSNVNAGHQWARGVDILAEYAFDLGTRDHLRLAANASYLDSRQQLSSSQPIIQLAGNIFSPPHWRGQAGVTWKRDDAMVNLTGHYIGGVIDNRYATPKRLAGMATLDLTARYALPHLLPHLQNLAVTVSAQNIFNAKPSQITISTLTDTPYDSANYSPVGRFLSFGVSTKW